MLGGADNPMVNYRLISLALTPDYVVSLFILVDAE